MFKITIEVNAPSGAIHAIKETLAMYMERFGDVRVLSITEVHEKQPQQMGFFPGTSGKEPN